jgi:type VI secretion system protein ImpA
MSAVTIEALLKDVSADAPCGQNLEYDPAYLELMRIAQGTPERQMGATIIPAEEPNWRDVRDRASELLCRTKDLTVAVKLCEAMLRLEGIAGLRSGLGVISGFIDQRWMALHPQLDPNDGNDPTARMTILGSLNDQTQFISRIRAVPLTNSLAGKFGLREVGWAKGQGSPPTGVEAPKPEVIEAAFRDTPPEELLSIAQAAEEAAGVVQAADARLTSLVGAGQVISFDPLIKSLREVATEVRKHLPGEAGGSDGGASDGKGVMSSGAASRAGMSGEIQSPEDVRAAIERICKYYELYEPSSPLPLLLRRAQRLVGKSFMEIMKDVSPEGVKQVESLAGIVEHS